MPQAPTQTFRVNVFALWRQVSPVWVGSATAVAGAAWLAGKPLTWPFILRPSLAVAIVVAIMYLLRPVKVTETGIYGLSRWGYHAFIAWDDIESVTFGRRHPFEPAFRLRRKTGGSIWIPRNTTRLRELLGLVTHFGGADNPLALALQTPLCDVP